MAGLAQEHGLFDRRTLWARPVCCIFADSSTARGPSGVRHCIWNAGRRRLRSEQIPASTLRAGSRDRSRAAHSPSRRPAAAAGARAVEQLMVRTKQNASYWLGLIAFRRRRLPRSPVTISRSDCSATDPASIWASWSTLQPGTLLGSDRLARSRRGNVWRAVQRIRCWRSLR